MRSDPICTANVRPDRWIVNQNSVESFVEGLQDQIHRSDGEPAVRPRNERVGVSRIVEVETAAGASMFVPMNGELTERIRAEIDEVVGGEVATSVSPQAKNLLERTEMSRGQQRRS